MLNATKKRQARRASVCMFLFGQIAMASLASAQDVQTTGSPIVLPVYDSIDENGVDLASGMLRLRSPAMTLGGGSNQISVQLEWNGSSWRYAGVPMFNRDGSRYYITYNGATREFRNYNPQTGFFEQRNPIDGSSLKCSLQTDSYARNCVFIDNLGAVVVFGGLNSSFAGQPTDYGLQTLLFGNMGMRFVDVYPNTGGYRQYGENVFNVGPDRNHAYQSYYLNFAGQQLRIFSSAFQAVPSSARTNVDHYFRPRANSYQTIIAEFNNEWRYNIDASRRIGSYQAPGGVGLVTYTYGNGNRVASVTTPAGTWQYAYADATNERTVTVTAPTGRIYSVTANKEHGFVTRLVESPNTSNARTTVYNYNLTTLRLESVAYPEGNGVQFTYDSRGNVTEQRQIPKPGSTDPILITQVGFAPTCTDPALCNRPQYVIDPRGGRTDFTYAPSGTVSVLVPDGTITLQQTYPFNHGQPVTVQYPLLSGQTDRRTVNYTYYNGLVASETTCENRASCAGQSDEVRTETAYINIPHEANLVQRGSTLVQSTLLTGLLGQQQNSTFLLPRQVTVTAGGQSQTTCYEYDTNGRLVTESPPLSQCLGGTILVNAPAWNVTAIPEASQARLAPTFSQ